MILSLAGGVLRLLSFHIIPVLTGAVAILLMNFSVHGQAEIEDDFWKAPAKIIAPTHLVENPVGNSDIVMHICCADTRLCSLHGMYLRYLTNMYCICGTGNRVRLAWCLVNAIRALFPNPPGQPYHGYKEKLLT